MHRRSFLRWIGALTLAPAYAGEERDVTAYKRTLTLPDLESMSLPCTTIDHKWTKGPFYIKVAISIEEPEYYPPRGLLNIEYCTRCGTLRLPKEAWEITK